MAIVGPGLRRCATAQRAAPEGVAVVAHPHPLYGGTMHNKVVQTLTRALVQADWEVVRFNFRGVGASVGEHDGGRGELQDLLAIVQQVAPHGPLALAGFPLALLSPPMRCKRCGRPSACEKIVLVGTAASRFDPAPVPPRRTSAPWCCMVSKTTPCPWPACSIGPGPKCCR